MIERRCCSAVVASCENAKARECKARGAERIDKIFFDALHVELIDTSDIHVVYGRAPQYSVPVFPMRAH